MDRFIFCLHFLVQDLNTQTQLAQGAIDMDSFFEEFAIDTSFTGPLRPRQIDKMQLTDSLDIFSHFLCLNLDNKDTMATSTCIVLRGFTDNTISITDEKKI